MNDWWKEQNEIAKRKIVRRELHDIFELMTPKEQLNFLRALQFDVKHRTLGRIRCKLTTFYYRFCNAFYDAFYLW